MPLTGRKILITEDEPDEMTYLKTLLEDSGASVVTANNGREALELVREEPPDLLTLDITMPGPDIGEILQTLRSDPGVNGMKICIISGRPELRSVLFNGFTAKPDAFVDKPFTKESVVGTLVELLEGDS